MEQSDPPASSKIILVAVLNWGLGHAARSASLIQGLLEAGHQVVLASDGRAGRLLCKEFPKLAYEELPAYHIRYGSNNMVVNIAWQWPKILLAAFKEHKKLLRLAEKHHVDLIISDSRFGCFHPRIKSIFLSHQLWIKTPISFFSSLVNHLNHWCIGKFTECWIPDWPDQEALAGELSRPVPGLRCRYLGPLSRMQQQESVTKYPLIALLSGPEPQRTRFEDQIEQQASLLKLPILIIQGKTEETLSPTTEATIRRHSSLAGHQLNTALSSGAVILCRAGYSSIMDLVALQKPAILVPTPGQTEQEYLADSLMQKGWFYSQTQFHFDLEKALEAVQAYHPPAKLGRWKERELLQAALASIGD